MGESNQTLAPALLARAWKASGDQNDKGHVEFSDSLGASSLVFILR